jgi:hypothetical protein
MRTLVLLIAFLALPAASAQAADSWFVVPVSAANDGSGSAVSASFAGAAPDGSAVYFATTEQLVPEDTDSAVDVYIRRGSKLELASGPAPGAPDSGDSGVQVRGVSADGSTVVFMTTDSLSPDDTNDGVIDIYEHSGGVTRLVSKKDPATPPPFIPFAFFSPLVSISADGRRAAFLTDQQLLPSDGDSSNDVYVYDRESDSVTLASGASSSSGVGLARLGGDHVYMETTESLVSADTDAASDIYRYDIASDKIVLATPGTSQTPVFAGISADGTHLFYRTDESVTGDDVDGGYRDVYQYANGQTALVSVADGFDQGPNTSDFQKASADGSVVYFTTADQLTDKDTDGGTDDIYERTADGSVSLVSTGPAETLTFFNAVFSDITPDGKTAFFYTSQDLTADDTDGGALDAYMRTGTTTTRISAGPMNDKTFDDAAFAGYAQDLSSLFFQTSAQMASADADTRDDFYARRGSQTSLVTPTLGPCTLQPSFRCEPEWHGNSADGHRVWLQSDEQLHSSDGDGGTTDVYESRLAVPGNVTLASSALAMAPGDAAQPLDPNLGANDPYDDVFGATVRIASGFDPGHDELAYGGTPGIGGSITGDTLTLSGRASDADYRAALRSVTFRSTSEGTRTIEMTIENGAGPGPAASRRVEVSAPKHDEPPPGEQPPGGNPPPAKRAPRIAIGDSGAWRSHLGARRLFRVPGLRFHCPAAAASACHARVHAGSVAFARFDVAPGARRSGVRRPPRGAADRAAPRGRIRLRAGARFTLAGSRPAAAGKRFLLLRGRVPRSGSRHGL